MGKYATLEEINAAYGGTNKPTPDGTFAGYKTAESHYQQYLNDLNDYGKEHGGDGDFNQTLFSLYQNYANQGLSNAKSAAAQAKASEEGAMNSKVQLGNMKEQALKYALNGVNASGLGGTGASESAMAGIGTNYMNQVNAVDIAKGQENATIFDSYVTMANELENKKATEHAESVRESQNQAFELASEMLNNGMSYDEVIELYGDQMSEMQLRTLDALTRDSSWLGAHTVDGAGYRSYEEMLANDVKTENLDYNVSDVSKEAKLLFDEYTDGRENGDCVRLEHKGGGSTNGMYLVFYNGRWYKTTKSEYNKATNKGWFKGGELEADKSSGTFTN